VGPGGAATFGCAAAIVAELGCDRAATSSGSGSRNALRKATSPCLRFSAETPDEEEEVWVGGAAAAGAGAEAMFGCGDTDDPGGADDAVGAAGDVYDAGAAAEADDTGGADGGGAAVDAGATAATAEAPSAGTGADVDDVGKSENDEHAASSGISAIAAAVTAKRGTPPRPAIRPSTSARERHPTMLHLYQAPDVDHKAKRPA